MQEVTMLKIPANRAMGDPIDIGKMIPWENLKTALVQKCAAYGLPVDVVADQMKDGGFGSPVYDCIAVYHQNHRKDFFFHVISQKELYGTCYLSVYLGGQSRNQRDIAMVNASQEQSERQSFFKSVDAGYFVPSFGIVRHIGNSIKKSAESKIGDENIYYDRVMQAITDAIPAAIAMPVGARATATSSYAARPTATSKPAEPAKKPEGAPATILAKMAEAKKAPAAPATDYSAIEGDTIEEKLANLLVEKFKASNQVDISCDAYAMRRVLEAAQLAVMELADKTSTLVDLPFISATKDGVVHMNLILTREELDALK